MVTLVAPLVADYIEENAIYEHDSSRITKLAQDALEDMKGQDLVEIEVADQTSVTDYLLVVSGTSNRHVRSLLKTSSKNLKRPVIAHWVSKVRTAANGFLVDLGSVVVHCMLPETRQFYDLEKLWQRRPGDAVESQDQPAS